MTPVSQYWFTFGHFCRKARALSIFGHEQDNIMLGCSWHFSRLVSWLLVRLLVLWALGCNRLDWWFADSQTPLLLPFFVQYKFSVSRSEFQGIFWSVGWILWRGQRSKLLSVRLKRINVQCFLLCQIFKPLFSFSNWVLHFQPSSWSSSISVSGKLNFNSSFPEGDSICRE